ncbi:3-hydroxy-D-aspartate aldolase-like isoform X2 [Biomphalaria glabrata]|nr:3-hydroxy-D-aspartate aldolase-like isoform X2 [Biomphalaria glabrata]XP_055895588.1 3-hydroxy-D-aspartate aldolase-like isoform X2 [Biomphalaria glabrata]XP_055895593.1 3-hydroxy-D-aspartate aldolase-like isoform X2 [Biomphalaria glabrata]XP_055895600.1 3-hydroxy-D-aspartate aldolase-like isoform X2 [Biomphalaria glabrata]
MIHVVTQRLNLTLLTSMTKSDTILNNLCVKDFRSVQSQYFSTSLRKLPFKQQFESFIRMFSSRPPCNVGDSVTDVETPALLVCLKKLEQNLNTLKEAMKAYPSVKLRPHAKTHKCAMLARLQIQSGAVGLCCQKLTEAEALVQGGIQDVLLSNQVINKKKLLRLASLARSAHIAVCVDSERNIEDLSEAAKTLDVMLDIVIEVNVGGFRCGVEPGPDVARLAKKVMSLPNIRFKGLHCYNGRNQHIRSLADRQAAVNEVIEKTKLALSALKESEIECNYVTGGGTGTFHLEAASEVFTEVQPGSYVFMDVDYGLNLDGEEKFVSEFQQSLYILSTVQSVAENRAIVDVGLKAVSLDSGVPTVKNSGDQVYISGGDEHGVIVPPGDLKVGDQLWLIPGHCDPTVNMHEWIVGMRDGRVESIWPIGGKGPGI